MTTHLVLLFVIVVFQIQWQLGEGWCFYFCPTEKWPETYCAVDGTRGAKLFQGRCQIWRANFCQTADYRVMDMRQCLDRFPGVVMDYLLSIKVLQRFDRSKGPPAVGPWRRTFLLWSFLSRLSPRRYNVLLPLLQWLLLPKYDGFDSYTYPGSPRMNPFAFSGSNRMNPFSNPNFDPFSFPGSPLL